MKVAVCMATYNGAKYLKEQVDSILSQLQEYDKLYISDDGSTDSTIDILKSYRELNPCLQIVSDIRIGGIVPNFDRTLRAAFLNNYDIYVLADQDDVWLPNKLSVIRKQLSDSDIILSNGLVVDSNLNYLGVSIYDANPPRMGALNNLIKNSYTGCCMAFKHKVLAVALPIPTFAPWHDWYIGLIGELFFNTSKINDLLIYYRRHGGNASPTSEGNGYSILRKIQIRMLMLIALIICIIRSLFIFLKVIVPYNQRPEK